MFSEAFIIIGLFYCYDTANILGIVPTPSYNHQVAFRPLWKELSKRGHRVTVLTTDPINDSTLANLTEIDLHFVHAKFKPLLEDFLKGKITNPLKMMLLLVKDLQAYLDKASQGFIYFSLGSNVQSKDLSQQVMNVLLQAFSELPYKILWKFEADLPNKPNNVFVSKWFPQQDIFRHPNIKLFITQGGLQSMDEAAHNHIPMVCIPFFGDQLSNAKKLVHKGLGLSLSHETMDKETLKTTIFEVIKNSKYRNTVTKLAALAVDQPMSGLEHAVWWTEYVLRHKGAGYLKSPAMDLPAYQYYLLDVIGFCLAILLVFFYLLIKTLQLIIRTVKCLIQSKDKTE